MPRHDEFDDTDGFIDTVLKRSRQAELPGSLRKTFVILGTAAVIGVLGGVIWTTYINGGGSSGGAVPVISADSTPYKTAPDSRGGMNVANKDSTVFETLRGTNTDDRRIENLLADDGAESETPVEKSEYFAKDDIKSPSDVAQSEPESEKPAIIQALKEDASPKTPPEMNVTPKSLVTVDPPIREESKQALAEAASKAVADEPVPEIKKEEPVPQPEPVKQEQAKLDVEKPKADDAVKAAAEEPAAAPKAVADAIKPTPGGTYYVQLASVKSDGDARTQWSKFQQKNAELQNLDLNVQQADLGAKGTYYRIQGGPLTKDQAAKVCAAIKSRGGSCLVAGR